MNETTTQARAIPRPRVWIDDGRWASIRPIDRSDAPGLSDFFASLSSESRRLRFLGTATGVDVTLLEPLARAGEGLVAVLSERGPKDGAIVGHVSVQADERGGAEIALAVVDELQGRGIGRLLLAEAVDLARVRGLQTVSASLLASNAPMRGLLLGAGCPIAADAIDAGVEEITLRTSSPA